jgi:hypothetical protein
LSSPVVLCPLHFSSSLSKRLSRRWYEVRYTVHICMYMTGEREEYYITAFHMMRTTFPLPRHRHSFLSRASTANCDGNGTSAAGGTTWQVTRSWPRQV